MFWLLYFGIACSTSSEKEEISTVEEEPEETIVVEEPEVQDTSIDCSTVDRTFFEEEAAPLLESRCYGCHNENDVAAFTRHVLLPFDSTENIDENFTRLQSLATETEDGAELLLEKPSGQTSHGGGEVIDMLSPEYATLSEMVARFVDPGNCENPGEAPMTCEEGGIYPGPSPFRRLTDLQYRNSVFDLTGVDVGNFFPPT